jgi:hypothetical protein
MLLQHVQFASQRRTKTPNKKIEKKKKKNQTNADFG